MPHSQINSSRITLHPITLPPAVGFPLHRSTPPAHTDITLGEWLELWMDAEIRPCRAETTASGYWNIIHNHIRPALGAVRLSALSPELINGYYQWLAEGKGLSPNTVRKHHVLLHTALKSAYRKGVLSVNPTQRATPPQAASTDVVYYTPNRLSRLLREVEGLGRRGPLGGGDGQHPLAVG